MMNSVNPARIWTAKARRGLNNRQLAEAIEEKPATVGKWFRTGGYALELSDVQLIRLSEVLKMPVAFFTGGYEATDWDTINMIGVQVFGARDGKHGPTEYHRD